MSRLPKPRDEEYWWIQIQIGSWASGHWTPRAPTRFGDPQIGQYYETADSYYVVGNDERFEACIVRRLRRVPSYRKRGGK